MDMWAVVVRAVLVHWVRIPLSDGNDCHRWGQPAGQFQDKKAEAWGAADGGLMSRRKQELC